MKLLGLLMVVLQSSGSFAQTKTSVNNATTATTTAASPLQRPWNCCQIICRAGLHCEMREPLCGGMNKPQCVPDDGSLPSPTPFVPTNTTSSGDSGASPTTTVNPCAPTTPSSANGTESPNGSTSSSATTESPDWWFKEYLTCDDIHCDEGYTCEMRSDACEDSQEPYCMPDPGTNGNGCGGTPTDVPQASGSPGNGTSPSTNSTSSFAGVTSSGVSEMRTGATGAPSPSGTEA